jgi:hypothetical protein
MADDMNDVFGTWMMTHRKREAACGNPIPHAALGIAAPEAKCFWKCRVSSGQEERI